MKKDLELDFQINECIRMETEALPEQRAHYNNMLVALYELGAVAKDEIVRQSADPADYAIHLADMCIELSDLITQSLIIYAKIKGDTASFKDMCGSDLIYAGISRQQQRMGELKEKFGK